MRRATYLFALAVAPSLLAAQQSLGERVRGAGTRTVAFSAAARPETCGDGLQTFSDGLGSSRSRFFEGMVYSHGPWENRLAACDRGPVRITVRVVEGRPSWMRVAVGPLAALGDSVLNFGPVSTREAGEFLTTLARVGDGRASAEALLPIVVVDSLPRWDVLASVARDTTMPMRFRRRASDLLARAAAATLPGDPDAEDDAAGLRREAVYALARKKEKSEDPVPRLLEIARGNRYRDARVAAMYSLGQTGDSRGVELFRSMLAGR